MDVVITKDETQGHIINKYKFKVLSIGAQESSVQKEPQNNVEEREAEAPEATEHALPATRKDELVESLLKKTDEMTSNFIKLQMKLEEQEEQHKEQLEGAKNEAYEAGKNDAKALFEQEQEASAQKSLEQFGKSVQALNTSAEAFQKGLGRIENELTHAALDIAKEVIAIELETRSADVAAKLSGELIRDLQNSARVTLKVNPGDHAKISEQLGKLEHVDLVSDSAISPGGVIAISDSGNIDSQIMKRYERIKRAALGGQG